MQVRAPDLQTYETTRILGPLTWSDPVVRTTGRRLPAMCVVAAELGLALISA